MKSSFYAIGYARISDPTQLKGDGIDNQIKAIERFAKDQNMILFPDGKVSIEVFSGRKTDVSHRPVYSNLIELIKKNPGKVKYFIINRIDRSTRQGSGEYLFIKNQLASLGVELRDTQNIIQPLSNTLEHLGISFPWSNKSSSTTTEVILAEIAKEDITNILTRTVNTSFSRASSGYKLREAHFGYKNAVVVAEDGKQKTIQVPDEKEGVFIRSIFDKTIEGVMTDKEITDYVNSIGYTSRERKMWSGSGSERKIVGTRKGKKLEVKQLQKYRKNPIYCGVNVENWGHIQKARIVTKTQYCGLVTIEKFNLANKGKVYIEELPENKIKIFYNLDLEKILKRRHKFRKDYIFKNVVLCDLCKKPLLASPSRSKTKKAYSYYHCSRGHKYYGIAQPDLDKAMMNFLSKISFSETYHKVLSKVLTHKHKEEQEKSLDTQVTVNRKISEIQANMRETLESIKKAHSDLVRTQLENDFELLSVDLANIQEERKKIEIGYKEVSAFLEYAKNLMEHPIEMFINIDTFSEQQAIYKILFDELPTYQELVSGTPKVSLFFKINNENRDEKSLDVTLRGIEPRLQP